MRNRAPDGLIHKHSSSASTPLCKFRYPQWNATKVSGAGELRTQRKNEYPCLGCDGKPALLARRRRAIDEASKRLKFEGEYLANDGTSKPWDCVC
jgi:hypothetical protein